MPMTYVTVFDAADSPFRNLSFLYPGFVLIAAGAILVLRPKALEMVGLKGLAQRPFFRWFILCFAVLWTFVAGGSILTDAFNAMHRPKVGGCEIVEGRVEHFHPMPSAGHDTERFEVKGVAFSYSDYILTAGFNNTSSHGGPIREGLPVRICYRDGEILRLDIVR